MNKIYALRVRGKTKDWEFHVDVDPKYVQEWRDDGLNIDPVINIIPAWWVNAGFSIKFWCFWQDLFNFKNPFKER